MRTIKEIAKDVNAAWANPHYAAVPYLEAMETLDSIDDMYYEDTARHIVVYFLGNAQTFRGEQARKLKDELKSMLT